MPSSSGAAGGAAHHELTVRRNASFDDTAWIDHLGIKGTNGRYDKASMAIAFANELGVALDDDRLYASGMNTPNTIYTGAVLRV